MATEKHHLDLDGGWSIWWSPSDPTQIMLGTDDPRFYGSSGPGMFITFSINRDSANYHPAYFNRCVRAFRDAGLAAPDECEEQPRHLRQRSPLPTVVVNGKQYVPAS